MQLVGIRDRQQRAAMPAEVMVGVCGYGDRERSLDGVSGGWRGNDFQAECMDRHGPRASLAAVDQPRLLQNGSAEPRAGNSELRTKLYEKNRCDELDAVRTKPYKRDGSTFVFPSGRPQEWPASRSSPARPRTVIRARCDAIDRARAARRPRARRRQGDMASLSFERNAVSASSGSATSSVSIVMPHLASTACCTGSARGMNANDCGRLFS